MLHALDRLVKGFVDRRRWTPDSDGIVLVPPPGAVDTSKVWQILTYQCYSSATLSKTHLYKKVNSCLDRFTKSVDEAAKCCDPNFLIYFWKICIELNAVPLPGKLKKETFVLLRILLKRFEVLFVRIHRSHAIIDFLRSLNYVLKEEPRNDFRRTLSITYKKTIDSFSALIGNCHAIVLGMRRHYSFKFGTKNTSELARCKFDLAAPYKHLLEKAELKYGRLGEQTISVLYDYASVMSSQNIDLGWVEQLQERSAQICRDRTTLTCDLTSRAFVFSTKLLANEIFSKERYKSFKIMEDSIEILKHGDRDCRVWAAYCSKTVVLWHKMSSGDRKRLTLAEEMASEQKRMIAIRSKIEGSQMVGEDLPKRRNKSERVERRIAYEKFQSSVLGSLRLDS